MPELTPIAPPTEPVEQKPVSVADKYELAVQARDPIAMMNVARETVGTPISQVAAENAQKLQQSTQTFDSLTKPIDQAGGLQTPEGRLKASDSWKTVKDNPQWGSFLVEHLLGNPNARLQATGGNVKTTITYDDRGNQLEEHTNELGQRLKVIDVATQKPISPAEYARLGGGRTSLENTLARKAELENQKQNLEQFNKNQKTTGAWGAAAPELNDLYKQKQDMLKQLYGSGLNNKQLEELASFTTRQLGSSQSISKGFTDLDQYVKSRGTNVDEAVAKSAKAAASRMGLKLEADGSIKNSKGETVNASALAQLQKNFSESNSSEQNYSQTQADAAKSMVYKNLGLKEKQVFDSILEIDRRIEDKTSRLSNEFGQPSFLVTPSAMGVSDQFARGEVQAIMGRFNSAALQEFQNWKEEQLKNYPAGQVPSPNQLEQAFVKTPLYKGLKAQYMEEATNVRSKPVEAFPETSTPSVGAPAQPPVKREEPRQSPTEAGKREEIRNQLRQKHRKE